MELFSEDEIKIILRNCGVNNTGLINYELVNYSDELVGYLGEHLSLIIECENSQVTLFVKCIPRFDEYRAEYLRQTTFFVKEYVLLSSLFNQFSKCEGISKWRPKLYYSKENAFVFEDVTQIGYTMPDRCKVFTLEQTITVAQAIARFHAQSFIFEEKQSKKLNRPYRIWDDFSDYLFEPPGGQPWRDTGRNAVMEILKIKSVYKNKPNFNALVDEIIPELFDRAHTAMKPSSKQRNTVVHRDIWANNVFIKQLDNGNMHALLVDYQTVVYAPPMLDISAFLFFNTDKKFREAHTDEILEAYHDCLRESLEYEGLNVTEFLDKEHLLASYKESILFGLTQAALIIPIANLPVDLIKELRRGGEQNRKFDSVSRSGFFLDAINKDKVYENRVLELFDDIVYRFILPLLPED